MYYDYIDPAFGIPLAIALWLVTAWIYFRKEIKLKIDTFFAGRREKRRQRYFERKAQMMNNVVPLFREYQTARR